MHVDSTTNERIRPRFLPQASTYGILGTKTRAQSDDPPGGVGKPVINHANTTSDLFPGMADQRIELRKSKTSRTSRPIYGGDGIPIDTLSSLPGRSGKGSVAQGRQAMRDDPTETEELKEPEPEGPREHLPLLFGRGFRATLTWSQEPPMMLPRYLRFLGLGAKLLIKSGRPCSLFGHEEGDDLPVMTLPRAWGRNVIAPDAPNGLRRAVMCKLSGSDYDIVYFDLERVGSQKIGIHCMGFRAGTCPDSPDVLAEVFHYRLEEGSWPTRLTHGGEFWTARMNHSPASINVDQRAANLIVHRAGDIFRIAG